MSARATGYARVGHGLTLLALGLQLGPMGCGGAADEGAPAAGESPYGAKAAQPMVTGLTGPAFSLTARSGLISTPDGGLIPMWGYAAADGLAQYPGPTLVVTEGDQVSIHLTNELAVPVSLLFPGHRVTAQGGSPGELADEVAPGGAVDYSFRASRPGTYIYYSGSRPELQVEMGLVGALIVRPLAGEHLAYDDPSTAFDREALFLLTEIDPKIHEQAAAGGAALEQIDFTTRFPVYWFINGRAAPDTMLDDGVPWLPHQPYGSQPMMHPGEKLLLRVVGGGHDLHPFHTHGNHARVIAQDGRLLESTSGAGPDLAHDLFTIQSVPGETVDAIFEWSGERLGWDIYGDPVDHPHDCMDGDGDSFDDLTHEYCPDHGKPFPVLLPQLLNLTFGGFWSGSPFLGLLDLLPPGEGGMNPSAAYNFMWHSHTEKEMVNNDLFPGGMMTMLFVEARGSAGM